MAFIYELAGNEAYTLAELCDIISEESGKTIPYINMEEAEMVNISIISDGEEYGLSLFFTTLTVRLH